MTDARTEIVAGERFAFGENWARFLADLDDRRIADAEASLREMLGVDQLRGVRFVDVGSGSGLFSLAARNLGADVVSFDFDPSSVACAAELRRRYHPDDAEWEVLQGSALDRAFLGGLGQFDVVYSWGVLHHTGDMWTALANVSELVRPGGRLFISIYNDQGRQTRTWKWVKRIYNRSGPVVRWLLLRASSLYLRAQDLDPAAWLYRRVRRMPEPVRPERGRGMDRAHDLVDWVGGYPFEVAKPEEIFDFHRDRGFSLDELTTCGGGIGCNQFVFTRRS